MGCVSEEVGGWEVGYRRALQKKGVRPVGGIWEKLSAGWCRRMKEGYTFIHFFVLVLCSVSFFFKMFTLTVAKRKDGTGWVGGI